jgi:serine/threonine protein kinase
MNIVHRDIKPDNILLELDNTIKLCDFGVSKQIKKGQLLTDTCGTPAFIAPEIFKEKPYDPYVTDIWSSGVVLYIIVSGFFPFRGNNETELRKSIVSGNFPKLIDISENLKDLLDKLLEINPEKRITIDEILKHPWLNEDLIDINNIGINIFTKAEKIIYGKLKFDYRIEHKENILENFTDKNILTEYEEENKNVKTISFIKTPYNTLRPRDDDEDLFYEDINIENDVMNFFAKVGEKNREYELRNNYDFDQGFIIAKKYNNKQKLMNSKNNSFDNDIKQQQIDKNIKNDNDKEKNCEKKNIVDKRNKKVINNDINKNKLIKINEQAIKLVEQFGYNKNYIVKSLQNNEINHAIASYYLILSLFEE